MNIKAQCECSGTTCTPCDEVPRGVYDSWEARRRMDCDDGGVVAPTEAQEVSLSVEAGLDRGTTATISMSPGRLSPPLKGIVACSGPFSVSGATSQGAYSESWTVALTPTGNGKSFAMVVTKKTTFTNGRTQTCTLATSQTRL